MSELNENYKRIYNWRKRKQKAHNEILQTCKKALKSGNGNFHETTLNEFEINRIIELLERK